MAVSGETELPARVKLVEEARATRIRKRVRVIIG